MLFNSYIFWLFFGLVFILYRFISLRSQNWLLLFASYVFYAWWDARFIPLLLFAALLNYRAAIRIRDADSPTRKKHTLIFATCINLGLLAVFKYYGFFSTEFVTFLNGIGVSASLPTIKIILPIGISFFTFKAISYTVDVHRGQIEPSRRLADVALYITFFPQLLAGPIERAGRLMPQITQPRRRLTPDDFAQGLYLILMGLFMKMVIADNMSSVVNVIFSRKASTLSGPEVLLGVYAFTFQIYGDFAGYSFIARGVGKWLGFDLMVNFKNPYFATNPREFWSRWHISLSTWLRDYLYIPLGGNRLGKLRTYRNLMTTMLLGGLWHGAGWTFIAWGFLHGLILCGHRAVSPKSKEAQTPPLWKRTLALLVMFHLVCFTWLLFRADSLSQVGQMLVQLATSFHLTKFALFALGMILFFNVPTALYELWLERRGDLLALTRVHWAVRGLWYCYLVIMMWYFTPRMQHAFIYFQF